MALYEEAIQKQQDLHYWLRDEGTSILRFIHEKLGENGDLVNITREVFGPPLIGGETFYWAPNIVDLISIAATSIPGNWTFMVNALPAPCGFFWLGKAISYPSSETRLRAISWVPMVKVEGGEQLIILVPPYRDLPVFTPLEDKIGITFFMEHESIGLLPAPLTVGMFPIGSTLAEAGKAAGRYDGQLFRNREAAKVKLDIFACMMSFLQQRILIAHRQPITRAFRRRAEREHIPLPPVNIVKLRHFAYRHHETDGGNVEWSCQWVVRGHWRNQWYPSISRNQPIWIAPYIKGPEDKPLHNAERLFAIVR